MLNTDMVLICCRTTFLLVWSSNKFVVVFVKILNIVL